jgi:hypothetical protein
MSPLKLLIIIAIVGGIAGFGILSNDILLDAQSVTVWDTLGDFTGGHTCECEEIVNGVPTGNFGSQYCSLTQHGQDLCT